MAVMAFGIQDRWTLCTMTPISRGTTERPVPRARRSVAQYPATIGRKPPLIDAERCSSLLLNLCDLID